MKEFEGYFNGIISIIFVGTIFVSLIWQPAICLMLLEAIIALVVNLRIYKNK